MNMEEKKAAILEKAQKEIARMEKEEKILSLLPTGTGFTPEFMYCHSDFTSVRYVAKDIAEAVAILRSFSLHPFVIRRDGCTSVRPFELFKEKEREKETFWKRAREFFGPSIQQEKYSFKSETSIEFWSKIEENFINVKIVLQNHPSSWRIISSYSNPRQPWRSASASHTWPNIFGIATERIKWATGERLACHLGAYFMDMDEFEAFLAQS